MKKLLILPSMLLGLVFVSCNKTPEACLTSSATTAAVNQEITIKSCSKDADRNVWNTAGASVIAGGTSCSDSVVVSYATPGTYTVNLNVKNYRDKNADCNSTGSYKSAETSVSITVN